MACLGITDSLQNLGQKPFCSTFTIALNQSLKRIMLLFSSTIDSSGYFNMILTTCSSKLRLFTNFQNEFPTSKLPPSFCQEAKNRATKKLWSTSIWNVKTWQGNLEQFENPEFLHKKSFWRKTFSEWASNCRRKKRLGTKELDMKWKTNFENFRGKQETDGGEILRFIKVSTLDWSFHSK